MARMFATTMQAAGDPLPTFLADQCRRQVGSRSSHQLSRLVQTAIRIMPHAHNQKPLLDQQRDDLAKISQRMRLGVRPCHSST
jgi:hypothetical protein